MPTTLPPAVRTALGPMRKVSPAIAGLYCSDLGHEISSEEMLALCRERYFSGLPEKSRELYEKLLRRPTRRRRFVVPFEEFSAAHDVQAKFGRFRDVALALMADAAEGVLRTTGRDAGDIDYLIVNYMAGKTLPSLSSLVANKLGMRTDIVSLTLGDMGCSAGVAAMDLAVRLLRSEREPKRALVLCLEPVSNLYQSTDDPAGIVGNTLFGEGCAALLISSHREPALWHIRQMERSLDSSDAGVGAIKLVTGPDGPMIFLSKQIPEVAGQAITENLKRLVPRVLSAVDKGKYLATRKRPRWQRHFEWWALHPGGLQVLDGLRLQLKLSHADLAPSYRVFEERSNMSSPSVFYALENIERAGPKKGDRALLMSFGSGFKVNSAVLVKGERRHHAEVERNAVVVGGTSGIGLDTARRLAAEGARVFIGSRRVGSGDEDFERVPGATYLPLDVTDDASVAAFADAVWGRCFGIDTLVVSSGVNGRPSTVGRGDPEEWATVVETNLTGAMRVSNALVPQVRSYGHVVFLNSILGRIPLMGNAAYCASKAGLAQFAESLEIELRRAGRKVTVHSLFPAYVRTPMLESVESQGRTLLPPIEVAQVGEEIMRRLRGSRADGGYVMARDRAIAGLHHYVPRAFKEIAAQL